MIMVVNLSHMNPKSISCVASHSLKEKKKHYFKRNQMKVI